jgi:hypothetical protein
VAKLTLTPALAKAAAMDAGNRSMRKAGRVAWNEDDFDTATSELDRLQSFISEER